MAKSRAYSALLVALFSQLAKCRKRHFDHLNFSASLLANAIYFSLTEGLGCIITKTLKISDVGYLNDLLLQAKRALDLERDVTIMIQAPRSRSNDPDVLFNDLQRAFMVCVQKPQFCAPQ